MNKSSAVNKKYLAQLEYGWPCPLLKGPSFQGWSYGHSSEKYNKVKWEMYKQYVKK